MAYLDLSPDCAARVTTGGSVVTVSTVSADGVPDIMACAWNCPYDRDQVLIVLDLGHTTTKNIKDTGRFVLGIPGTQGVADLLKAGSAHGRDIGDKFKAMGFDFDLSPKLGIPVLRGMLAYVECELLLPEVFSNHGICVGKAVALRVDEAYWNKAQSSFEMGLERSVRHVAENVFVSGGAAFSGVVG